MTSLFADTKPPRVRLVRRGEVPFIVASFSESTPPTVWHSDLTRLSCASLDLRENEDDWEVCLTQGAEPSMTIAHFDTRADAEAAFVSLRKALLQSTPTRKSLFWRMFALGLILFFVFLGALALSERAKTRQEAALATAEQPVDPNVAPMGVPVDANTLLRMPPD